MTKRSNDIHSKRVIFGDYERALEAVRQASVEFRIAQLDYRSRKIGDEEFLANKAKYDAATARFDAAYIKAQNA